MKVDVLVVGSGIAGLCAAIAAKEAGAASILVVDAAPAPGGTTSMSAGIFVGAPTRYQRAAGIEDSADSLYRDYMNLSQWGVAAGLVKRFALESGPTLDWLGDLGVSFIRQVFVAGGEDTPRCIAAIGRGKALIDTLVGAATDLGIQFMFGSRIVRLVVESGTVVGAASGDEEFRAPAVILATGGIGADSALLDEWFPSSSAAGDWRWYAGSLYSRGDAVSLSEEVGAFIAGRDRGLRLLHPRFVDRIESYHPGWLVFVDRSGRRVVDETGAEGMLDRAARYAGGVFWAIFDRAALDPETSRATPGYRVQVPELGERQSANWNSEMIGAMVNNGRVVSADTVEELAERLSIDAKQLTATIERYNAAAGSETDEMGKEVAFIRPVASPPFHGAEIRLASVVVTATGPGINRQAEVVDSLGKTIPGLYAAGEAAGGLVGTMYFTGGTALSCGAVFGRIAGHNAAARR
ncbi:hypothetical protein BH09ACT6_BH09ACT6_08970 [soil metagenome]